MNRCLLLSNWLHRMSDQSLSIGSVAAPTIKLCLGSRHQGNISIIFCTWILYTRKAPFGNVPPKWTFTLRHLKCEKLQYHPLCFYNIPQTSSLRVIWSKSCSQWVVLPVHNVHANYLLNIITHTSCYWTEKCSLETRKRSISLIALIILRDWLWLPLTESSSSQPLAT